MRPTPNFKETLQLDCPSSVQIVQMQRILFSNFFSFDLGTAGRNGWKLIDFQDEPNKKAFMSLE